MRTTFGAPPIYMERDAASDYSMTENDGLDTLTDLDPGATEVRKYEIVPGASDHIDLFVEVATGGGESATSWRTIPVSSQ
jgi:hypothetical protein